jgi:SAM-dependent methyltransferase
MDTTPNRFLRSCDLKDQNYDFLKRLIEYYYANKWNGTPHPWGSKNPSTIKTHWSREWEYPWAIINSDCESNENFNILDCGCGGSPLMPFISDAYGCNTIGIDLNYGDKLYNNSIDVNNYGKTQLADLKNFYVNPTLISSNFTAYNGSMANMPFDSDMFDRVFCISVIEHIPDESTGKKCVEEMVRVLKPGGKLLITMDHTQHLGHIKPWCLGQYQKIIDWSGLSLDGNSDFTVPSFDEIHGLYHVVGFVLKKD